MIPTIVPIIEDEMFTSWMNHVAGLNGYGVKNFSRLHLGFTQNGKISSLGNLDCICNREKGSNLFPDVRSIIRYHTKVFVDQVYTTYAQQAKTITHITRGRDASILSGNENPIEEKSGQAKTCPLCAKDDMEKYGRVIIHIPHQARGVEACYKHGVLLGQEDIIAATPAQKEIAVFSHEIYKSDLFTDYYGICRCIDEAGGTKIEMVEEAIRKGYLPGETKAKNIRTGLCGNIKSLSRNFIGYLTYLFKDDNAIKEITASSRDAQLQSDFLEAIAGEYRMTGAYGMVVKLTCIRCGYSFHTHPEAILRNVGCPECDKSTASKTLLGRYVKRLGDDYSIAPFGENPLTHAIVTHEVCGNSNNMHIRKLIWGDNVRCKYCNPHIGESATAENGEMITIDSYESNENVDIRFPDGTIVKKKKYKDFKTGNIRYPGITGVAGIKKERIGEIRLAKNGMKMTIIEYRNCDDIDIQFEDGTIVRGRTYGSFKKGTIAYPKPSRVGESTMASNGMKMTIIAYRTYDDIDIQFEDGAVVKNRRYQHFKTGKIKHP